MNVENLDQAPIFRKKWLDINRALNTLNEILEAAVLNNPIAHGDPLYSIYLNQHSDGSGWQVDMSGLDVGEEMLKRIRAQLITRKVQLEDEIKAL